MTIRESTIKYLTTTYNAAELSELKFGDFKEELLAHQAESDPSGNTWNLAETLHKYWSKKGAAQFNAVVDSIPRSPTQDEIDEVENSQLASVAKADRVVEAKENIFWQHLDRSLTKAFKDYSWSPPQLPVKNPLGARKITLMLSDLHFGSDLEGDELPLTYGKVQESRRFAKIIYEACQYKKQYRDETQLNVLLGGDIIQGQLHDPRTGAPLAEQMARAIYLLEKGIKILAQAYPQGVTVHCTTGNHGRNMVRHKKTATDAKWDSLETVIYYAVMKATAGCPNVKWIIPKTPYVEFDLCGRTGFLTHGDTVLRVGNPGKSINVSSVQSQVNKINASRPSGKEYAVFIVGHVHVGSVVRLQGNKRVLVSNGALIPPDGFCTSLGIFDGNCGQQIWESVDGHPFGDSRFLEVDAETDADESLDKIIPPWKSLNE